MDYETGEIVAYAGSADPTATKATKKFQPRFDVLADGWRQPGSAFKPVVYSTGIDAPEASPRPRCSWTSSPTSAAATRRPTPTTSSAGPVRVRDALQFSLNIPAVKALRRHRQRRDPGAGRGDGRPVPRRPGRRRARRSRWASRRSTRMDLVRAYGTLGERRPARRPDDDPSRSTDSTGKALIGAATRPKPEQVLDPGAAGIMTDILAGNTDPKREPVLGPVRDQRRRPAPPRDAQDRHQQRRPRPQRLRLHRRARATASAQGRRVRAGGRRLERQLRQLAGQHGRATRCSRSTSRPTSGRASCRRRPRAGRSTASRRRTGSPRRPWTRGRASRPPAASAVDRAVPAGHRPRRRTLPPDSACGEAVLQQRRASRTSTRRGWPPTRAGWPRAERGPGVRGGPENTRDRVLLQPGFQPVRPVLGPAHGRAPGCAPSRRPVASIDPCASPDPARSTRRPMPVVCPSPVRVDRRRPRPPTEPPTERAHRAADARADPGADARAHAEPTPAHAADARRVLAGGAADRPVTPERGGLSTFSGIRPMIRPAATGSRDRTREPSSTCHRP